jgi:hypothetical protein
MTFNVYQHWDPLRTCVVGRSYPPEFYSWITVPHVRRLFERIATETEEDFQLIISKLEEFGVNVMRPEILPIETCTDQPWPRPPMTPRDTMIMIGDTLYIDSYWPEFYRKIKGPGWQDYVSLQGFLDQAPEWQVQEVVDVHGLPESGAWGDARYNHIYRAVADQGNDMRWSQFVNGAMVSRIGRDLYFATEHYDQDQASLLAMINREFTGTRNHVVNTGGHGDSTYCPVCPGLIVSLRDVPTYQTTFPGWEVVYLPNQSWDQVRPFLDLKARNHGKWWIPGFEYDSEVISLVESWLGHWVGYVEETVFDVNMLIIDPKNVMVFNHNQQVFDALSRYGITAHVVPFRHRYFWDGGIHCVTMDLDRDGHMQDYFPERQ